MNRDEIFTEIKRQTKALFDKIGMPVSVLIDTLYRQIIMTGGVPYSLNIPKLSTRDSLTDEQFNTMTEKLFFLKQSRRKVKLSGDETRFCCKRWIKRRNTHEHPFQRGFLQSAGELRRYWCRYLLQYCVRRSYICDVSGLS